MLALRPNTARFTLTVSAVSKPHVEGPIGGFGHVFGTKSDVKQTVIEASGEVSVAPQEANVQVNFLGLTVNLRIIGSTLYTEEPFLKRLDGGRPWVEKQGATLHGAIAEELPGGLQSDPTQGFAGLVRLLQGGRDLRELAPATMDGQATKGFSVGVDLLSARKLSARERRVVHKLFVREATIEAFIAENGLPVRTRAVLRVRHHQGELIGQSDITAIEVPVSVQRPPAAETISEASLKRLMSRARLRVQRRHKHRRS
jgi:hypothetical protein